VEGLEKRPASANRAGTLQEEIEASGADNDPEAARAGRSVAAAADEKSGLGGGDVYNATLSGSGAIAQGKGASATAATGKGSIAIGSVGGNLSIGNQPMRIKMNE
jgi:hypothetical protein